MKTYSGNKWHLVWVYLDLLVGGKSWVAFHARTKPMKGGHTHNHKRNAYLLKRVRSKDGRGWAKY